MSNENETHWLYRKQNRSKLWGILGVMMVLALIPEFFVHHHAHFEAQGIHIDASFGFYAWYGLLSCAAMIVLARFLGIFLKRKDSYYDE